MKSYCRIVLISLCFSSYACASKIIIYHHSTRADEAEIIRNIFTKRYSIPEVLITKVRMDSCQKREHRYMELCVNRKGELIEFSNSNIKKIKKSLAIFAKPEFNDV
jgi:hypothetical protein